MRALTDREKRTIRRAAIALGAYLLVFYGLRGFQALEARRGAYALRLLEAERLKLDILREKVKAQRLEKLKKASGIDLAALEKALEKHGVVGQASAAIQSAAQAAGFQLGPARESPGRSAAKELATVQLEGQGTTQGAAQFLHALKTLGYPVGVEWIQLKTAGMQPGQVHLSLGLVLLDYKAWKSPAARAPEKTSV